MSERRQHGSLAYWKDEDGKRFGFLRPSEAGGDVYVGGPEMDRAGIDSPRVGDLYSFEVVADRRGDRAVDVRRAGAGAAAERVFNSPHQPVRP
jgi:cold shock CspA family protein